MNFNNIKFSPNLIGNLLWLMILEFRFLTNNGFCSGEFLHLNFCYT